jgi:hypothetical protein
MDKECAIFNFIESPDGRADLPYFIPLDKFEADDVKITVEFSFNPDALFQDWLREHGTRKQRRVNVKQEGGSKGGGGGGSSSNQG